MRDRHRLVPDDFDVPDVLEHPRFRLRMLSVNDLVKDYDAVMSSVEHLRTTFSRESDSSWPEGLTIEDDLVDLGWHQREFTLRSSGYTEWISSTTPVVTIGWDWRIEVSRGRPRYVLAGFPRSNLMFQDAEGRDLGPVRTTTLLKAAVDAIGWQEETEETISARYAPTT